jgi:lambda family phage portal protein
VRNTHPGDYQFGTKDNSYKEIKASDKYGRKNIYHLYHVDRPGQTRGIPFFAPVLTYFKDLGSYAESELVAARISACYAMIVETEASMDEDPVGGSAPVLKDGQYLEGNIEPGMIKRLYPGEKFNSFNPTRPSSTFEPFVLWILRSISTSLGLPYELVTKDFSRTNYSSARAALLQAYKFFKKRQHWFAAHMCQPTWASVLEEAYLKNKFGDIPFYEFYYYFTNALWMPDGWEWVDPLKEARAEEVELKNGTTTLSEIYSKKGQDWEEALEQRAKEKKKMKELGISDEDIKKVITDKEEKEDEEEDDVEDDDEK